MIDAGAGGSLICIASNSSTQLDAEWVACAESRHALLGLMRAAASDYGRHGIRSSAIAPAWGRYPDCAALLRREGEA